MKYLVTWWVSEEKPQDLQPVTILPSWSYKEHPPLLFSPPRHASPTRSHTVTQGSTTLTNNHKPAYGLIIYKLMHAVRFLKDYFQKQTFQSAVLTWLWHNICSETSVAWKYTKKYQYGTVLTCDILHFKNLLLYKWQKINQFCFFIPFESF